MPFGALAGIIAVCLSFFVGCTSTSIEHRMKRALDGSLYLDDPTLAIVKGIKEQFPLLEQRLQAIDGLATIMEESEGYARFAAAKAILHLSSKSVGDPRLLTKRSLKVIAHHCIRVSRISQFEEVSLERVLAFDDLPSPTSLKDEYFEYCSQAVWNTPVDIAFEMEVDGQTIPLTIYGHPLEMNDRHGWRLGRLRVWLDDIAVVDTLDNGRGYVFFPLQHGITREKLLGLHEWKCDFELIAPNGMLFDIDNTNEVVVME